MNLINMIVSVVIELARVLITFSYFKIFLNTGKKITHMWTCVLSFFITTICYVMFNISIVNVVSTIAGILIISMAFEGKARSKVLLSILCCSIMITTDFAVYFIYPDNGDSAYNIVVSFLSILFFYIVVMLLKLIFRKKLKTEFMGQWYILLVVSIMSVCLLIGLYSERTLSDYGTIYLSIMLLTLNLLLYVFYSNMLDRFVYYKENEQLKQQMNFYEQQLKTNVENDQKIRAIRHDMKHHIREINSLAESGRIDDIKTYTEELAADIRQSESVYNTGNIAFDGILNYYNSIFEQNEIRAEINVVIPENLGIAAYDLNIILGNLFDNAIENVVRSDNPKIVADIKYVGHVLYISIANTYDGNIKKDNDVIISRKAGNHGYGLDNVKRIVCKYNGDIKIEHNAELFIIGVVLYA